MIGGGRPQSQGIGSVQWARPRWANVPPAHLRRRLPSPALGELRRRINALAVTASSSGFAPRRAGTGVAGEGLARSEPGATETRIQDGPWPRRPLSVALGSTRASWESNRKHTALCLERRGRCGLGRYSRLAAAPSAAFRGSRVDSGSGRRTCDPEHMDLVRSANLRLSGCRGAARQSGTRSRGSRTPPATAFSVPEAIAGGRRRRARGVDEINKQGPASRREEVLRRSRVDLGRHGSSQGKHSSHGRSTGRDWERGRLLPIHSRLGAADITGCFLAFSHQTHHRSTSHSGR